MKTINSIAFFSDNFPPRVGGVSTFSYQLAFYFHQYRPDLKVMMNVFDRKKYTFESSLPMTFPLQRYRTPKRWQQFISTLRACWRCRKYDVFHVTTLFPEAGFVALACLLLGKKFFLTVYGTEVVTRRGSRLTKWLKRFALSCATAVLSFSKATAAAMHQQFPLTKIKTVVIYPGIQQPKVTNRATLRSRIGFADDDIVVLFVGRFVKRKGAADLIQAIALCSNKKIKALLVGNGEEMAELRQLTTELNLDDRIIFTGSVPFETVGDYYQASDIFTMPSFFESGEEDVEGLGLVYLEAQSLGLPVIGTTSGGIPEAIADGRSGYVIPERDVARLAECIRILSTNKDLYEKMSENARIFVKESFSWMQTVEGHEKIYSNA